jgi:hypothetical protein
MWEMIWKFGDWIKEAFKWVEPYLNMLMVCATFALALTTCDLAKKTTRMAIETRIMADATKAMADLTRRSVELSEKQFMIKAFPSLVITNLNISLINLSDQFSIGNYGEISAFKFKLLQVYIYENDGRNVIIDNPTTYYDGPDKNTSIEHEKTIPSKINSSFKNSIPVPFDVNINKLKYKLIFTKFFVPYDTKETYEIYAYSLTQINEEDKDNVVWRETTTEKKEELIHLYRGHKRFPKDYVNAYPSEMRIDSFTTEGKIRKFFDDYPF